MDRSGGFLTTNHSLWVSRPPALSFPYRFLSSARPPRAKRMFLFPDEAVLRGDSFWGVGSEGRQAFGGSCDPPIRWGPETGLWGPRTSVRVPSRWRLGQSVKWKEGVVLMATPGADSSRGCCWLVAWGTGGQSRLSLRGHQLVKETISWFPCAFFGNVQLGLEFSADNFNSSTHLAPCTQSYASSVWVLSTGSSSTF